MTVTEQREKLAIWLKEWQLEKSLPTEPVIPPSNATTDLAIGMTEINNGDIILLPPVGETTANRPVYVAVIDNASYETWTCVPFSRFSTPATDGEMSTGREFKPLKVICAWNSGKITGEILRKGWLVGHLAETDVKILLDYIAGTRTELPDSRRGPKLVHPLDPRHDYIEEERSLWFDFRSAIQSAEDFDIWSNDDILQYPEAAESDDNKPLGY